MIDIPKEWGEGETLNISEGTECRVSKFTPNAGASKNLK